MMSKEKAASREQIEFLSLDQLVPEEHLVRKLENAIDWNFIYELVEEKYCADNGHPSLDPVTLIKLPVLQYMFGIRSMRQTIKEADVNMAYRWFLGLGIHDPVPHFSTFGKNYTRRFKETDLFEQIFQRILTECFQAGMVDASVVFVDSTHVKARANGKKYYDQVAEEQTLWYENELREEIQKDRAAHGKRPLKNLTSVDDEEDIPAEEDDEAPPSPPKASAKGQPNKNTSKKKAARQKKKSTSRIAPVTRIVGGSGKANTSMSLPTALKQFASSTALSSATASIPAMKMTAKPSPQCLIKSQIFQ